jgi:hypothetical protein
VLYRTAPHKQPPWIFAILSSPHPDHFATLGNIPHLSLAVCGLVHSRCRPWPEVVTSHPRINFRDGTLWYYPESPGRRPLWLLLVPGSGHPATPRQSAEPRGRSRVLLIASSRALTMPRRRSGRHGSGYGVFVSACRSLPHAINPHTNQIKTADENRGGY